MNNKILFFLIPLFIGCQVEENSDQLIKTNDPYLDKVKNDSTYESDTQHTGKQENCNCNSKLNPNLEKTELTLVYYKSELNQEYKEILDKLSSNDSLRNSVQSLRINIPKIPDELKVFKNIEHVTFDEIRGFDGSEISGLDYFPILTSISIWGSMNISIKNLSKSAPNLKYVSIEKTTLQDFEEFSKLSDLKSLNMIHSGIDKLPSNWSNLKCLRSFIIKQHSFGELYLGLIDLSVLPCLDEFEITTINDVITGIPKGLQERKFKKLVIRHPKLTDEEKKKLDASR